MTFIKHTPNYCRIHVLLSVKGIFTKTDNMMQYKKVLIRCKENEILQKTFSEKNRIKLEISHNKINLKVPNIWKHLAITHSVVCRNSLKTFEDYHWIILVFLVFLEYKILQVEFWVTRDKHLKIWVDNYKLIPLPLLMQVVMLFL